MRGIWRYKISIGSIGLQHYYSLLRYITDATLRFEGATDALYLHQGSLAY